MKAKKVYEQLLRPKSEEEVKRAYIDYYGFIPSNETLIINIPTGDYPVEYHEGPDGRFWKFSPSVNKRYCIKSKTSNISCQATRMDRVKIAEENWIHDVMNGDIKLDHPAVIYKENYH
jgi:hypothetical protein